jgi:hypothetical protein
MGADYKLKLSDLSPYLGISKYVSRNSFNEGTLIPKEPGVRWRLKLLEFYNIAFGTAAMLAFSMNEKTLKNGLEYLITKAFLKN